MSTGPFHPALALMIAAVWLIGFVFSYRLLRRIGINSRASRIVLGTVPPSAAMILTIQILGFVSTASPLRCVVPAIILPSFIAALTAMLLAWHLAAPSDQQATMKSVCSPSATNCSSDRRPPGNRWWLLPAVVLVGTHLVFVIDGISRYPTGSDALNYHLPAAARWVQDGALSLNPADWRL